MPKVKVCGITNLEDALMAQELGAYAIGFVFHLKSKRYIEPCCAKEISKKIKIKKVGVFVNLKAKEINEICSIAELNYAQLHGIEDLSCCDSIKIPYIKNIRTIEDMEKCKTAAAFLVDKEDNTNWGGTGELADWDFALKVKNLSQKPLILSGGLNCDNIKEAIEKVKPNCIDISSGLESSFGIKDYSKMREFFDKIKSITGENHNE